MSAKRWLVQHEGRLRVVAIVALTAVVVALFVSYARKASRGGSAFMRWRPIVLKLGGSEDIYSPPELYPTPPLMAMLLWPLEKLHPPMGALVWFWLKVGMAVLSAVWVFSWLDLPGSRFGFWPRAAVVVLSLRPVLSDLQHGNINLWVLLLICACWDAYRRGRDVRAGVWLALAITCKVTPGLLAVYFLYKKRLVLVTACVVGMVLFLVVVPGLVLGPKRNWQLLTSWHQHMVAPFLEGRVTQFETENHNQSVTGVAHRLLRQTRAIENSTYTAADDVYVNVASLSPTGVAWVIRTTHVALLVILVWLCRAAGSDRRDPRGVVELGLVLLAMLLMSERSWKAHYVTVLIPYAAVVFWVTTRADTPVQQRRGWVVLALSFALLTLTAPGFIGACASDYTEAYGLFLLGGVALFVGLGVMARRAWRESRRQQDTAAHGPPVGTPTD